MKTAHILIILFLYLLSAKAHATIPKCTTVAASDSTMASNSTNGRPGAMKWTEPDKEKIYFLAGFAVSADVVGLVMKTVGSNFSQIEIAGNLNHGAE